MEESITVYKITPELRKAITEARLAKKMSQKDLAANLGVPKEIINKWEGTGKGLTGIYTPSNKFVVSIEKVLKVKLPRLVKVKN